MPKMWQERILENQGDWIHMMSVAPDGQRAIAITSGAMVKMRVWDLESGRCLRTLELQGECIHKMSVAPDGQRAVSVSEMDFDVRVWDLHSGARLRTLQGHTHIVASAIVTPDGRWGVSTSSDFTIRVWDLESGVCVALYSAPAPIASLALARRGTVLCVGSSSGSVFFLYLHDIARDLDFSPDVLLDTSDEGYEQLLRRGLEYSRRERGADHEETMAHLMALAVHLENEGKPAEAAAYRREHDETAARVSAKN